MLDRVRPSRKTKIELPPHVIRLIHPLLSNTHQLNTPMSQILFPEIRAVAEETEKVVDSENETENDDGRQVQEIESLCMRCGEQVRRLCEYDSRRCAEHTERV